ncbi:MAG TPA: MarR family transcriptional regulator [Polyangiaceae bacterium]|nr:MarR family transcriptional regulator [Polyangiaceae bacterium]
MTVHALGSAFAAKQHTASQSNHEELRQFAWCNLGGEVLSVPNLDRPPLPELGNVLDFMRLIWQVDHALQRTSKRMQTSLGVTGPQRFVIRIVGKFPGIPAGHLAELLHVHPSTLTGILKRLEGQGLIQRRLDARDRRRSLLRLTNKGRRFEVGAEGTVEAAIRHALDRTPAPTIEAARRLLTTIAETLDNLESPASERSGPARRKRTPPSPRR